MTWIENPESEGPGYGAMHDCVHGFPSFRVQLAKKGISGSINCRMCQGRKPRSACRAPFPYLSVAATVSSFWHLAPPALVAFANLLSLPSPALNSPGSRTLTKIALLVLVL